MPGEMLDGGAVERVAELAREAAGKVVEINGVEYSTTKLHDPRKAENEPRPIGLHTLQSLADYVNSSKDDTYRGDRGVFLHVTDPQTVAFVTEVFGDFNQRVTLAVASAVIPDEPPVGRWMPPEDFNIALLSQFETNSGRESVFKLTGNLRAEAVATIADDGISQEATARKGIVGVVKVDVPCPVLLRPFRTFTEIGDQPESPFVLRLRGGGDGKLPACALFECDGGRWRLEAVKRIKEWLLAECSGVSIFG